MNCHHILIGTPMNTKAVLIAAGVAALASHAQAADLRGTLPPEPLPPSADPWTGFHIGALVGYADAADHGLVRNEVDAKSYTFHRSDDSIVGGGEIGYDMRVGATPVVLGLEADATAGDIKAKGPTTLSISHTQTFSTNRDDIDVIATLRGRLGYALDRTLIYATGGLAIRDGETIRTQYYTPTFAIPFSSTPKYADRVHDTALGYVVGAGIEYAFADHWSVKAEYNYLRFDDMTADYPHGLASVDDANIFNASRSFSEETIHLAKLGFNYRF